MKLDLVSRWNDDEARKSSARQRIGLMTILLGFAQIHLENDRTIIEEKEIPQKI